MSLRELLNEEVDNIERPVPTPEGEWKWRIDGVSTFNATKDKPGGILLKLQPREPGEDVDQEEFEAFTADEDLDEKIEWHRLPVGSRNDQHRAKKFFASIGCDVTKGTLLQVAEAAEGMEFLATVTHAPSDRDEEEVFVRLRGFCALEDAEE